MYAFPTADTSQNLSPQARRNYALNAALIRADNVLMFTMILFFMTILHSASILLAPLGLFIFKYGNILVEIYVSAKSPLTPLPRDIKARIGKLVALPKRTIFLRGSGNDCTSVSFYFFHFIFLPQGFENDLENSKKQAILMHELSHDRFFDYLSLFWLAFAVGLFIYAFIFVVTDYLNYMNPIGFSWERYSRTEFYSVQITFSALVALSVFNSFRVIHRREHNADFGAYLQAPELYLNFLKDRVRKDKYYRYKLNNPYLWVLNKIAHPPIGERLAFLTGEKKIKKASIIVPALIYGFCPPFIAFSVAVGFATFVEYATLASVLSLPFSAISVLYCGLFFRDVFKKDAPTTSVEKLLIWLFMLIGSLIYMVTFIATRQLNYDDASVMLAIAPEQLNSLLMTGCFCVVFAYVQFALYLWGCAHLTSTFFAGVLALPVFASIGYILLDALSDMGGIGNLSVLFGVILVLLIPPVLAVLIEYFIHFLIRVFRPADHHTNVGRSVA